MSDILQKMAAVHEGRSLHPVAVPEYGFTLYFTPLTVAERARVRKGVAADDDEELWVNTLIHKARDKDGNPVFSDDGKTRKQLYQMDMQVLKRILEEAQPDQGSGADVKND